MSKAADVFISYKSEEYGEANNVRKILTANGISCWMAPESIPMGSNYTQVIPAAIENCKVFLLILSEKSQRSRWVALELDRAMNAGKIIYPLQIEQCDIVDPFNFMLSQTQRLSAFTEKSLARERLVGSLKQILNISEVPQPEASVQPEPVKEITETSAPEPAEEEITETPVQEPEPEVRAEKRTVEPIRHYVCEDYEIQDGVLSRYSGKEKVFIIPEGVVEIAAGAFYLSAVERVEFPTTLRVIGRRAFSCCNLRSIALPDGITELRESAFIFCRQLQEVNFPQGLRLIGDSCFEDTAVRSVCIPSSVRVVGQRAFARCANLSKVELACESVGKQAFWECPNIREILVHAGVQSIGKKAFSSSESAKVTIHSRKTVIDNKVFHKKAAMDYRD